MESKVIEILTEDQKKAKYGNTQISFVEGIACSSCYMNSTGACDRKEGAITFCISADRRDGMSGGWVLDLEEFEDSFYVTATRSVVTCVSCKFYSYMNKVHTCIRYKSPDRIHVVTGEVKRFPVDYCVEQRSRTGRCGLDGKMYEPIDK